MTLNHDPEREALAAEAGEAVREHAGLIFRFRGTFTKEQNGRLREYPCRFSVKDPVKADRNAVAAAQAFATAEQAAFTDVRLLKVHPDDSRPPEGSVLAEAWDGGVLRLVRWAQTSDFSGIHTGLCLLRR